MNSEITPTKLGEMSSKWRISITHDEFQVACSFFMTQTVYEFFYRLATIVIYMKSFAAIEHSREKLLLYAMATPHLLASSHRCSNKGGTFHSADLV